MKGYIGQMDGEFMFQEIKDGLIRGFNVFNVVELVDGTVCLTPTGWYHKAIIDGQVYESGMVPAPKMPLPAELENAHSVETVYCEECGGVHDAEEAYNPTFVLVGECGVFCKECVQAKDLLVSIEEAKDLFKAKDLRDVETKGFEEIETLFCDSSGIGSESEPALTRKQALAKIEEIMEENQGTALFAGITNIGQFQVYVSIFKKAA